ncbi:6-phosphogluconolactonase [Paraneptunicella aestuarii]|uniref:6-phosphogluconolactonase n=1 Tax=Paraneptunicella aestuarii TaxID=2831148 RepID=UPI0038CD86A6
MIENIFKSAEDLNAAFAERIVQILQEAISQEGRASLLVSGGRTPMPLFKQLSETSIDWSKVDVSLVDERWVDETDESSNTKMVRENLLQSHAAKANFVGLKSAESNAEDAVATCTENLVNIKQPFDVLILGMGEDGHTASLFPCSQQIKAGLDLNTDACYIAVQPTTAPHQRMSLTLKSILNSKHIFLHLTGDGKKAVIEQALAGDDPLEMPIRAVLQHADVELMWAP